MNIKNPNALSIRPMTNIGCLFDIPTGTFIRGEKNEMILNGGLSGVVGVVGPGNSFKSTLVNYMALQASNNNLESIDESPIHTYDSEDNMGLNLERYNTLAKNFKNIIGDPMYEPNVWSVLSKSEMAGDDWVKALHEMLDEKVKDKKNLVIFTPFRNKFTNLPLKLLKPNTVIIDSFTEFESNSTVEAVENDADAAKTVFMQQGLFKTKVLKQLPRLSINGNTNFLLTAHVGKEINMASGPFAPQPKKSLQFLGVGDKVKGVSDKLYFLTTHLWHSSGTSILKNSGTRMAEYPKGKEEVETDLNIVRIKQLRSKSGVSGFMLEIIISQTEGVLPSLTEFHFIKNRKFGLDGNARTYNVVLYPDVNLTRTTVRSKIDSDPKLRRAINITSELAQMHIFMKDKHGTLPTAEELYEGVTKQGYSWDKILTETRGWWTIDNYKTKSKFLSTLDLIIIMRGNYKGPYKK